MTYNNLVDDFNPRSHEGSDLYGAYGVGSFQNFNPRSHEGSDPTGRRHTLYVPISIHAPTRGATESTCKSSCILSYFNPRSHEGSDDGFKGDSYKRDLFQSTLPRGERLLRSGFCRLKNTISIHAPTRGATGNPIRIQNFKQNFNPRSHEGSDHRVVKRINVVQISIHAPTRGATGSRHSHNAGAGNFNPRSHEGSDGCI